MFMTFSIIPLIGLIFMNVLVGENSSSLSLFGYITTIGGSLLAMFLLTIFRDKVHKIMSKFSMIIYPFLLGILSIGFFYLVPLYSSIIIITGIAFNVLAVIFNNGKMPVYTDNLDGEQLETIDNSAIHKLGKNANLFLLIDRISLPNGQIASIGDLLITTGVWIGFISNSVIIL